MMEHMTPKQAVIYAWGWVAVVGLALLWLQRIFAPEDSGSSLMADIKVTALMAIVGGLGLMCRWTARYIARANGRDPDQ